MNEVTGTFYDNQGNKVRVTAASKYMCWKTACKQLQHAPVRVEWEE